MPTTRDGVSQGPAHGAGDVRRHVLRNALLPTIAVVATQIGYLLGGLVIVERTFNYPGLGPGDRQPRGAQGLRRRAGGGHGDRRRSTSRRHVLADIAYALLNPRIRFGGIRVSATEPTTARASDPDAQAPARSSRRETLRGSLRSPAFLFGVVVDRLLGRSARSSATHIAPYDPTSRPSDVATAAELGPTRSAPTARPRRALARARGRAQQMPHRSARGAARASSLGTALGLMPATSAAGSTSRSAASSTRSWRFP